MTQSASAVHMPCASITSKANCLETMRVEWHSYQKPLRRCGRVRRQQQFDYYCKAPNPLQSISQIIENVFFVLASLFLVQWICAPLPTHSAAQHSTESLLPNSEGTKRRCKSRYCTDFVTWILKRQIFYVTKIFGASVVGQFRQRHVSVQCAPTNAFRCWHFWTFWFHARATEFMCRSLLYTRLDSLHAPHNGSHSIFY